MALKITLAPTYRLERPGPPPRPPWTLAAAVAIAGFTLTLYALTH